jgi:bacteriorhodopsin
MLFFTAYASTIIQILAGLVNIYGLNLQVPDSKILIQNLLQVETTVQLIELIFYIWMVYNINNINNITQYRYADWFFTTPIMLITLMTFIDGETKNVFEYIGKEKTDVSIILVLNMLMLLFGFLGEIKYLDVQSSLILGFIPFIFYYYKIYKKLKINNQNKYKKQLFWAYFIFWSLYGVAAGLEYELKNAMYNILDLFAKNLFGIFLVANLLK